MKPSNEAIKKACDAAGPFASVAAVMHVLEAAYSVDFDALRAENEKLRRRNDMMKKTRNEQLFEKMMHAHEENEILRDALKGLAYEYGRILMRGGYTQAELRKDYYYATALNLVRASAAATGEGN